MHAPIDDAEFHARFRQRDRFAREVSASVDIDAPRELVWRVLTELVAYPAWNPMTPTVEGELRVGARVVLHVDMPRRPRVVQRAWVNLVEPPQRLCWGLHMGHRALLTTNRFQELTELADGRTRYDTTDQFSGWLAPLVLALYGGPMRAGFEGMAAALKQRSEALAGA